MTRTTLVTTITVSPRLGGLMKFDTVPGGGGLSGVVDRLTDRLKAMPMARYCAAVEVPSWGNKI